MKPFKNTVNAGRSIDAMCGAKNVAGSSRKISQRRSGTLDVWRLLWSGMAWMS
jgi:hypothetical protein